VQPLLERVEMRKNDDAASANQLFIAGALPVPRMALCAARGCNDEARRASATPFRGHGVSIQTAFSYLQGQQKRGATVNLVEVKNFRAAELPLLISATVELPSAHRKHL
jgi:hypothetical protein